MIRGVFFDFYGTLVGWQPAGPQIQTTAAAAEGVSVDSAAVGRAYSIANAYLDSENARSLIASRNAAERDATLSEYERRLLSAAGVEVGIAVAGRIWQRVNDAPKELVPFAEARTALEAVRAAGLSTGVISNMGKELPSIVDGMRLGHLVDVVVSSGQVGVGKPHAPIFEAALRQAGLAASEAVHVGDSYGGDVVGAQGVGMYAILVAGPEDMDQANTGPVPADCPRVTSLAAVVPHLREAGLIPY